MGGKVVALSRNYTVGSTTFDSVTLRPPCLKDYREIGPVEDWQRGADGALVRINLNSAIWDYAERLVTQPGPGPMQELDLADTLEVEDAIRGFFREAVTWHKANRPKGRG